MVATWRGGRDELLGLLRQIPLVLSGRLPDSDGVGKGLALRLGVALLSQVQQDFLTKARGGTGRDGIQWKPLLPATIARRRLGPGDKKSVTLKARGAALTPAQKRAVEKDVRTRKAALLIRGLPEAQATGLARAAAEAKYRGTGAIVSKRAVLGSRRVEILRDTGRLFKSLEPGIDDKPSGAAEQKFVALAGSVTVGSLVVYAGRQHADRPFWPAKSIPAAWLDAMYLATARGIRRALDLLTRKP